MKLVRLSRFQDMGVTFADLNVDVMIDGRSVMDTTLETEDLDLCVDWVAVEMSDLVEAVVEEGLISQFLTEVVNAFQIRIREMDEPMVVTLGYERFNCDYNAHNRDDQPAREMKVSVSKKEDF